MKYVIALGTNLGDREQQLSKAVAEIEAQLGTVLSRSSVIETDALVLPGAAAQPSYLNSAVLLESSLAPQSLLQALLGIERLLGRERSAELSRWSPRVIDLDIIAAEQSIVSEPGLEVPHPEMHARAFVLVPFCELWPAWRHPILGLTAAELLARLRTDSPISPMP